MTIASTRNMICNKLSSQFDTLTRPAQDAVAGVKAQVSAAKAALNAMSFSPEEIINSATAQLESDVKDAVPDPNDEDVQEVIDFINQCSYLQGDELLKNPVALMKSATNSVIEGTSGLISDLASSLPEFNVGEILGSILDKFSGFGDIKLPGALNLGAILRAADEIINCIAGRCGPSYSDRVTAMTSDLQDLFDNLTVIDDPLDPAYGEFDLEGIYDSVGLTLDEKVQMGKVTDAVQSAKTDSLNAVNASVSSIKSAARSVGGIF